MKKSIYKYGHLIVLHLVLFSFGYSQSERFLLHFDREGKQEAIPLKEGEKAIDAIGRIELAKMPDFSSKIPNGIIDTIRNYSGALTVNFGFTHQDIALMWWEPQADGVVKELWWHNYIMRGDNGWGSIRGWEVDSKLLTLPGSSLKHMGYYRDPHDGDGFVTPFKPVTGDQWFYKNGAADSLTFGFDPLGTESVWLPGGIQVNLDSAKWQGIKLDDWGDPFPINYGEPFGFTLSNDSPAGGADARMEILSAASVAAPYHAFKWYEVGRTGPTNKGWWWRPDYEWGMYVVVEYQTDRAPIIREFNRLLTTSNSTPREVKATVTDDNPGGGPAGVASVYLFYKISPKTSYDSIPMVGSNDTYSGKIPGAERGVSITYYIVASDLAGNRTKSLTYTYSIFKPEHGELFVWNSRTRPLGRLPNTLAPYYMMVDSISQSRHYDIWDVSSYEQEDLSELFLHYRIIIEACAEGGFTDLSKSVESFLLSGAWDHKRLYLLSDQDRGSLVWDPDSGFSADNVYSKYFGIQKFVSLDYPQKDHAVTLPWHISMIYEFDNAFGFISSTTYWDSSSLWYDPYYELGFVNTLDEITPTEGAKVIFKDGNRVIGIRNSARDYSWYTYFLAFDYLSLNFRSDTSLSHASDPKYKKIFEAGSVLKGIYPLWWIYEHVHESQRPTIFSLSQNYPNPFNPVTTIKYSIGGSAAGVPVSMKVLDILGREIATLVNEEKLPGEYEVLFDARNLSSSVYFYTLKAGNFISSKKLVLLK